MHILYCTFIWDMYGLHVKDVRIQKTSKNKKINGQTAIMTTSGAIYGEKKN